MANEDLLQSDSWEQFQRALGRRTHRVDGVLAIEMPMPFGLRYWYSPRGPFPVRHCEEPKGRRGNLTSSVQRLAHETGTIFWRAEFDGQVSGVRCSVSEPRVMRRFVEPEWTWRTSLVGSDDERLAVMHEKHRYNVRLAERKGVVVRAAPPPHAPPPVEGGKEKSFLPLHSSGGGARGGGDVEVFWSLLQDTVRRQGIATHPRSYYEMMFATLPDARVYFVEHSGMPVACAIVAYHGDTATYLHGGSSHEHRNLMAPHLLHWKAMRDAKAAGLTWYDWGGVQPEAGSRKPEASVRQSAIGYRLSAIGSDWSGMTRFKMGFGGEVVHHPPTMDLVFRPNWYRLLSWLAKVRP